MKKKIIYTNEPEDVDIDRARRVDDFLPPPGELTLRKNRVVTLRLDEPTIGEIKKVAVEKGIGVSTLIRIWVRERVAERR